MSKKDFFCKTHPVLASAHHMRLDQFLKQKHAHFSRAKIQKIISQNRIQIHRKLSYAPLGIIKPHLKLCAMDQVCVFFQKKPEPPVSTEIKIFYEDADLLVLHKPGNLPVHPAGRYYQNTLWMLLKKQRNFSTSSKNPQIYLAHRLDRETSGLMVLAKTLKACTHLTAQFAARNVKKRYLAMVFGIPDQKQATLRFALSRDPNSQIRLKMHTNPHGMLSCTHVQVLRYWKHRGKTFSLIKCRPATGRQHQIRVHLKAWGHPIVGDKLYSLSEREASLFFESVTDQGRLFQKHPLLKQKLLLPRQALHASFLSFLHPRTQRSMEFSAPLPLDLKDFLHKGDLFGNEASCGPSLEEVDLNSLSPLSERNS